MMMLRRWRPLLLMAFVWTLGFWYMYGGEDPSFYRSPDSQVLGIAHWRKLPDMYPVPAESLRKLPTTPAAEPIPKIQAPNPEEAREARNQRLHRREAVRDAFRHSWKGYKDHAWMHDEVKPLSGSPNDPFSGWAATLVDSLDTLWIMNLNGEFEAAVKAAAKIDFTTYSQMSPVNVFETNIRYLGGFLAAYEISGKKYKGLLKQAVVVGDLLMSAFDTPNRMPITRWDIHHWLNPSLRQSSPQTAPSQVLVSEIGSLTLEFTKLTHLTGDPKYYDAVQRVSDEFAKGQSKTSLPGMWPVVINARDLIFNIDGTFTLGGMSDSLYEYLPKQYLLLGGSLAQPREMYEAFIPVAKQHIFRRALNPQNASIVISGDAKDVGGGAVEFDPRGQHLSCFAAGMVGLGAKIFSRQEDMALALQLAEGCVWSYDATPCGIGPEIFSFIPCASMAEVEAAPAEADEACTWSEAKWIAGLKSQWRPTVSSPEKVSDKEMLDLAAAKTLPLGMTDVQDRRYILRPEAIEAVFLAYRLTGDKSWQEKAWTMFERIEALTRTKIAAAALEDVTEPRGEPRQTNGMESFWFAETLKYFYLVFCEFDVLDLDEWVLNTEAHPLRRLDVK